MLVWSISGHLDHLEQIATRFGPYICKIYIVPCRFTLVGLLQALRKYGLRRKIARLGKQKARPGGDIIHRQRELITATQSLYLGWWATGRNWLLLHSDKTSMKFFLSFAGNIISQGCLRPSQTTAVFLRLLRLCPNSQMSVLPMDFSAENLGTNKATYGRAAPQWSFELSTYCDSGEVLFDGVYSRKLQESVNLATAARIQEML